MSAAPGRDTAGAVQEDLGPHYAVLTDCLADPELSDAHVSLAATLVDVFASQDVHVRAPHPARPALEAVLRTWWAAQPAATRTAVLALAATRQTDYERGLDDAGLAAWVAVFLAPVDAVTPDAVATALTTTLAT